MISKYEKTNGVKLFALVAVLAMVFAGAAVMMSDSGVDATNEPTRLSGAITATQEFGDGTEVVVNGELTIPTGMALIISGTGKLTVESGAVIEIAAGGQLIFQQVGTKIPTVTINGDIVAQGTISDSYLGATDKGGNFVNAQYFGAIVNNTTVSADGKAGVFLNGNITLERGAELWSVSTQLGSNQTTTGDSQNVIPITVTGISGSDPLAAPENGGQIVMGASATLDVTKRSSQISVIADQNVLMNQGATVTLNGHIDDVTISATSTNAYYTVGSVAINGDGHTNSYQNEGKDIRDTSNLTFTVTSQTTPALFNDGTSDRVVTVREYIVNIEGTVDAGDYLAVNAAAPKTGANYYEDNENHVISGATPLVSPSASVTGNLTITNFTNGTNTSTIDVAGYINVSGTITAQYTVGTNNTVKSADVKVTGTAYITGSVSLHIDSIYTPATTDPVAAAVSTINGGTFIVDGGKMTLVGADLVDLTNPTGTVLGAFVTAGAYTVTDENGANPVTYYCDFAVAVQEAVEAGADGVYAFAAKSETGTTTAEEAIEAGATVVDTQITIPADMTLYIYNVMVIAENGELVLQADSGVEIDNVATTSKLYVLGKVTDYDYVMSDYTDLTQFIYEVKKTTETETEVIDTYTSLAIALKEAQPNDEIQLVKDVVIESNMEIPADVTVITAEADGTNPEITIKSATLTVNGTLVIDGTPANAVKLDKAEGSNTVGSVVVNNVIRNADTTTFTGGTVPGAYFAGQIGEDAEGTDYVTSAAVASQYSATATAEGIAIYGKLSMGDVTFTQGENPLTITINGEVSGNVTIAGEDVTVDLDGTNTAFTGSVSYAATAGTATVQFTASSGATLKTESFNDGETITTNLAINGDLRGNVTISAGSVNAGDNLWVGNYADNKAHVTTVASGATLNVLEGDKITVYSTTATGEKAFAGLVIDGILNIDEGSITVGATNDGHGQIAVNGTLNVSGVNTSINGIVKVAGAMNISEETGSTANISFAQLYIGSADGAAGAVNGPVGIASGGFVVVYPGADITNAAIAEDSNGETTANVTDYYINGEVYMTSYALGSVTVGKIVPATIELVGYEDVILAQTASATTSWYTNEDCKTGPVNKDTAINADLTALYAKAEVSQALVYVSVGSNMTVYIDDVRYSNGAIFALDVGQHTISVQVNAGYTGETSVLVGGTAVTGGTFEITPQMAEDYSVPSSLTGVTSTDCVVISVSGSIAIDSGATGGDDGMGLTEILLIILVVLIVVMAIMVALRLMRS